MIVALLLLLVAAARADVVRIDWNDGAMDVGPVRFLAGHHVRSDMADLIAAAKTSVLIESPYFIPPRFFRQLLLKKLAEGVRIVVVTNSVRSTDGLLPQVAYLKYRGELARAGHRLPRVQEPGLPAREGHHCRWTRGHDPLVQHRSALAVPQHRITCVAENEELARALQELIDGHIANAWTIPAAPRAAPLRVWRLRLLLPILEHQL